MAKLMKFCKYVVGGAQSISDRMALDVFEGTKMVLKGGFVEIWNAGNLVAVTMLNANETMRVMEGRASDPTKRVTDKIAKAHDKDPFNAVVASREDMVALANDRESAKRGRKLPLQ